MKRFEFRLDKVLDYRKKVEEEKLRELGKAKHALREAEHKVSGLKNHQREQIEELRKTDFDNMYMRILYDHYLFRIRNELSLAKDEVNKKSIGVDKKREEVIESSKPRKAVEKLKERRIEEHAHARGRWEQKLYDESAKHRFLNKND